MASKTPSNGGLLTWYLNFCVLVGALWVGIARRRLNSPDRRQDVEALVGGVMIFGAVLALWFATEPPFIDLGSIGDGVEGFTLGGVLGFVVTGLSLALRVLNERANANSL